MITHLHLYTVIIVPIYLQTLMEIELKILAEKLVGIWA